MPPVRLTITAGRPLLIDAAECAGLVRQMDSAAASHDSFLVLGCQADAY